MPFPICQLYSQNWLIDEIRILTIYLFIQIKVRSSLWPLNSIIVDNNQNVKKNT